MTKKWISWKEYKEQKQKEQKQKQKEQEQKAEEPVHHCGEKACEGEKDCGELWCGCIDICRGQCGLKEWS